jgi:hypothetical protein
MLLFKCREQEVLKDEKEIKDMAQTLVFVSEEMFPVVGRKQILVSVPDELKLGEQATVEYGQMRLIAEVKQAQSWKPQYEGDKGQYVEIVGRQ